MVWTFSGTCHHCEGRVDIGCSPPGRQLLQTGQGQGASVCLRTQEGAFWGELLAKIDP